MLVIKDALLPRRTNEVDTILIPFLEIGHPSATCSVSSAARAPLQKLMAFEPRQKREGQNRLESAKSR
jgi:hypothetical protein